MLALWARTENRNELSCWSMAKSGTIPNAEKQVGTTLISRTCRHRFCHKTLPVLTDLGVVHRQLQYTHTHTDIPSYLIYPTLPSIAHFHLLVWQQFETSTYIFLQLCASTGTNCTWNHFKEKLSQSWQNWKPYYDGSVESFLSGLTKNHLPSDLGFKYWNETICGAQGHVNTTSFSVFTRSNPFDLF